MTLKEIEKIKKIGEQQSIREAISSRLWDIGKAIENCRKDSYKRWAIEITKLKTALADAEQLFKEL